MAPVAASGAHGARSPAVDGEVTMSEEENEVIPEDNVTAYSTLLQSLQAKGGSFADAYAQRKREERGASSSDEEGEPEEIEMDGVNSEEVSEDEADDGAIELQLNSPTPVPVEIESGRENGGGSKNEVLLDDQVHSQSEDESDEDVNETRVASGELAGICSDPFKDHMEHILEEGEIAHLVQAKHKFNCKIPAAGVQGGSWIFNTSAPKEQKNLAECGVKKRLQDCWKAVYGRPSWGDFDSEQQCQFFSLCNSYKDTLLTNKTSYKGSGDGGREDSSIMDAYVFHILNHITKTRDLITKNNEKLQRTTSDTNSDPPRDQGFTRPKVLVLLPFRSSALKFVDCLLKLAPLSQKSNVEHKARFFDDFGVEEDDPDALEEENRGRNETKSSKPADFRALFSGNNDDHFRIGIKFTRKSIKLYSEFYASDIIIASSVGLITRIGEAEMDKDKDIDFLSSIEIAVIDHTDVILMQNWSHVVSVFDKMNKIPAQQHGTDFMRIREWYLNGHARHYRQTIILSSFSDAGVNALFHRACVNHAGKVKTRCEHEGVLAKVVLQVRQVYEKIDCSGIVDVDDLRFELFVKQIFPKLKNSFQDGTMIFTRSYFDFVRLRNFLKSQNALFCLLGEYTKQSDVSRARSWFYHGTRKILLYTERAHFFHRYKVRGIKDLIFYSLPDHAHFYLELLNLLEGKENPSCTILFSQFDNLQLERIVGSSRSKKMLSSPNKLFMFC